MRQDNNHENDNSFLTTLEVAELLRVHQRTVQRWIKTNQLKAVKVGLKIWRIRQQDLDKFLAENEVKNPLEEDTNHNGNRDT
jgi:excisionase family DNA binding protein